MYLRHTTVRKNGKERVYWRLVRSVRNGRKVRQETVAMLGELDSRGRAKARALADAITGRRTHPSLFEPEETDQGERVAIRLNAVRIERSRQFGGYFIGLTLWRALKLDVLLERLIPAGREDVPWPTLAAALVLCRLCSPSSELHIAEDLYRRTALDDLLGLPEAKVNDDRLYRALDRLLPHKRAVEMHLKSRLGELFGLEYDLLLYDVTSTYFEGLAKRNPQAKRGYSRDHRPDCKQVCIALVVTRDGMPLAYEVFDGNRVDVTTVEEIVTAVEERYGKAERVWIMDRGMASEANFEWLREGGRLYLIGASKSELRRFEAQIVDRRDWRTIREDVEVKLCESPDGAETFVLCRSQTRREKDRAIVERFAQRLEARLASLARRLERARKPASRAQVERQIGRMLEQHSRAAGKYVVRVEETDTVASGLRLVVEQNNAWSEWAELSEGCYLLRTNVKNWSDEDLWRTYIQLTDAEAAFRIQKSELSIRPVWHQREDRVQAHIFVCFLAYVLWKTLEQWQRRAGLGRSPRTLLEELAQIQSADVVLQAVDGRELRVRCVVRPGPSQALLLARLGLELPKRLRTPKGLASRM
jgi:transposase